MKLSERMRTVLGLSAFAILFFSLTISSYVRKSATADEPINLATGVTILKLGDYRIHPDNLPLLRMWLALPLVTMDGLVLDTNTPSWKGSHRLAFTHEFVYQQNDADRLLTRARFMNVLLGFLLGLLVFSWARELYGWPAAMATLALFATEPNILAHASVVTTDMGTTLLIFASLYCTWRLCRNFTAANLVLLTIVFTLAMVSKFTSLVLLPMILGLLACRPSSPPNRSRWLTALGIGAWLLMTTYGAIWAAYGFRYLPRVDTAEPFHFTEDPWVTNRVPHLARTVAWIDAHKLLPNAASQGFALEQSRGQQWASFLNGNISKHGWWYYFPEAFLIKTPIALLLLGLAGFVLCFRRTVDSHWNEWFILLPLGLGAVVAMTAHLDVGLRHILPLYPFVLLLAGKAFAALFARPGRFWSGVAVAACLAQAVEVGAVYPDFLAFFNRAVGGPDQGYRYLSDSNIDWGQDLKGLKQWMTDQQVTNLNLAYFGSADPAYYGIHCTYLVGSPYFAQDLIEDPRLPGYVAVSVHNLTGAGLNGNLFYTPLLQLKPIAVIGHSIQIYWVAEKWW